jgi:ABC-2 type transport system ATP-binding protein
MIVASLDHVTKRYRSTTALDDLSLHVNSGEVLALLGPNGSGKTTAIGLLLGLRRPDAGRVRLLGADPSSLDSRRAIGVTPQELSFPGTLTVSEIVRFVQAHFAQPRERAGLLDEFGLTALAQRETGGLSTGQRRRLAIALAFAGDPRVVVLDEPTTGLDTEARRGIWRTLRAYAAGGGTIILTTHYLEEAEALADRVVLVNAGRVVAEGTVDFIRAHIARREVRFRCAALPPRRLAARFDVSGDRYTALSEDADGLIRDLVRGDVPFRDLEVFGASFEDAVVQLTEQR